MKKKTKILMVNIIRQLLDLNKWKNLLKSDNKLCALIEYEYILILSNFSSITNPNYGFIYWLLCFYLLLV